MGRSPPSARKVNPCRQWLNAPPPCFWTAWLFQLPDSSSISQPSWLPVCGWRASAGDDKDGEQKELKPYEWQSKQSSPESPCFFLLRILRVACSFDRLSFLRNTMRGHITISLEQPGSKPRIGPCDRPGASVFAGPLQTRKPGVKPLVGVLRVEWPQSAISS